MVVKGRPYRTNLQGTMSLSTMRAVKDELGFGWGHVMRYMDRQSDDVLLGDLLCDNEFLAWVWAWMLNADGDVKFGDVLALTVDDIAFTANDEAPKGTDDEADPTPESALTGSGLDGGDLPRKGPASPKKSSKTSKQPSTGVSR